MKLPSTLSYTTLRAITNKATQALVHVGANEKRDDTQSAFA